jgi:hypothetical protein
VATNQLYSLGNDIWFVFGEFTLTAAGAVVPNADGTTTTDPLISVARTGAGTYLGHHPWQLPEDHTGRLLYSS